MSRLIQSRFVHFSDYKIHRLYKTFKDHDNIFQGPIKPTKATSIRVQNNLIVSQQRCLKASDAYRL